MTPLPLPRRGARASLSQPHRGGASPFGRPQARTGAANISTDSAASARDVETQLTAGIPSATPSPQAPVPSPDKRVANQERADDTPMDAEAVDSRVPSLSYPENPYPPLRTQATYDSQGTVDTLSTKLRRKPYSRMHHSETRTDETTDEPRPTSAGAPSTQTEERMEPPASQPEPSFTMQFCSGRLALRMDSEPPEGDSGAMDVEPDSSALPPLQTQTWYSPLQLQTQAFYPSQ